MASRLLILLALLLTADAHAQSLQVLLDNGPTNQRVNVVVLSEGYTVAQLADFPEEAKDILNDLLATPPYDRYADLFNGFAISVASAQSGSDHPSRNEYRDTYFDTYYDCVNIERLICIGGQGYSRAYTLLQDFVPDYDIVLMLVNDPQYGGSGGAFAVTSTHPEAGEIAIHEVGHSFARLNDEYGGTGGFGGNEGPNVTQERRRAQIRWGHWIEPTTPIPTPNNGQFTQRIGLFEGAEYNDFGWFRPAHNCKMRALGVELCRVCTEHTIAAAYNLVPPIQTSGPRTPVVELEAMLPTVFEVQLSLPALPDQEVQWFLNDLPIDGATTPTLNLAASDLPGASAVLSVEVRDTTPLVRDPGLLPLLTDTRLWTVRRPASTHVPGDDLPQAVTLGAPYPNPVQGQATFTVALPQATSVQLDVLDITGRQVAHVADAVLPAGTHRLLWDVEGRPPGIYMVRLHTPTLSAVQRLVVVR
ncbi:MAG: M64 family metallopeptidase [Bacteroidota bacterium]